jgi:hypothetical protein
MLQRPATECQIRRVDTLMQSTGCSARLLDYAKEHSCLRENRRSLAACDIESAPIVSRCKPDNPLEDFSK